MADSITEVLDEALEGYKNQCTLPREWSLRDEVRALRERLKLSQVDFARRYNIPIGNLQNWEQASRGTRPDAAARLLIKMIKADPERVAEIVSLAIADSFDGDEVEKRAASSGSD